MSSFAQVVKYLDINRASKDTTVNTKPLTIEQSRAIKKLLYYFEIPAFTASNAGFGTIVYQINYTATHDFRIFGITDFASPFISFAMCIRYRVGGTVYRYRIPTTNNTAALDLFEQQLQLSVQAPKYANEVIKKNFSIEIWSASYAGSFALLSPTTILTNRLVNPSSAEQTNPTFMMQPTQTLTRADLDLTFPESIPSDYVTGSQWLTN